jgi:hypothetical protein
MITATNESALRTKHHPGPKSEYVTPPRAGPNAKAALNIVELSAIALVRSSRVTISSTKDCRAGASKALAIPPPNANNRMCHGCIQPAKVRTDKASASSIITD